jgi:hypothetical protein
VKKGEIMENISNPVSAAADAGQGPVVEAPKAQGDAAKPEPQKAKSAEVAEPQQEKARQSADENARYAAARRKAEQEAERKIAEAEARARDKAIAEVAKRQGWRTREGKEISSFEEYERAARDIALMKNGLDPSLVDELLKNDPTVRRANEILEEQRKKEDAQREWSEFFDYFREEYGRNFDPMKDKLPQEVLDAQKAGAKIKDAYLAVRVSELKAENEALQKKLQAQKINLKNAESAVGSLKSDGAGSGDFISYDVFEANKHDQDWVVRNLDKITKSRASW